MRLPHLGPYRSECKISNRQFLKNSTDLERGLSRFIPHAAISEACLMLRSYSCHLKITPGRKTKLGDFRPAIKKGQRHQLSVNGDLNRYAFLVTLIHEIAHMTTWNLHQHKVKPHGQEWKGQFKKLMNPFLDKKIFPEDVHKALENYMSNPAAASCTDLHLTRALRNYDRKKKTVHLEEIPVDSVFVYNKNRLFKKGEKLRKRFQCVDVNSKRKYLFHPLAEVELVESTESAQQ